MKDIFEKQLKNNDLVYITDGTLAFVHNESIMFPPINETTPKILEDWYGRILNGERFYGFSRSSPLVPPAPSSPWLKAWTLIDFKLKFPNFKDFLIAYLIRYNRNIIKIELKDIVLSSKYLENFNNLWQWMDRLCELT